MSTLVRMFTHVRSIQAQPVTYDIPPGVPGSPLWNDITPEQARDNSYAYGAFIKDILHHLLTLRAHRRAVQAMRPPSTHE